jgi:hypothetical protein
MASRIAVRATNAIRVMQRERKLARRFELEIGNQVIFVHDHNVGVSSGEKR